MGNIPQLWPGKAVRLVSIPGLSFGKTTHFPTRVLGPVAFSDTIDTNAVGLHGMFSFTLRLSLSGVSNAADTALHCWLQFRFTAICAVASAAYLTGVSPSKYRTFSASREAVLISRFATRRKNQRLESFDFIFLRRRRFMIGNLRLQK